MVKLVCYNIEYCEGMKGHWYGYLNLWNRFFPPKKLDQKIVDELNKLKLDILALVEVDRDSRFIKKDEVRFFSKNLKLKNRAEDSKYLPGSLLRRMPMLDRHESAIVSKYKISNIKYHYLRNGAKRTVIEAQIKCPKKVTLLLVHLALFRITRKKQIFELVEIVNGIKGPVILMGDFNTYQGEVELEPLLKNTRLKSKRKLDKSSTGFTEPTCHPFRILDYILTTPEIMVKKYSVLKYPFSDHLPLFLDFKVK